MLEHHHILPRSQGGTDEETNFLTLCAPCHGRVHETIRRPTGDLIRKGQARARRRGKKWGFGANDQDAGASAAKSHKTRLAKKEDWLTEWAPLIKTVLKDNLSHVETANKLNQLKVPCLQKGEWTYHRARNWRYEFETRYSIARRPNSPRRIATGEGRN